MKKMRKMIPAIAMLLVSAVMLTTASYAWFTISTDASAVGMSVKAEAASSMLITKALGLADWQAANGQVDLTSQNATTALVPATHDSNFTNGLKQVGDASKVDPITGAYTQTGEGAWIASTSANYVEYTAYLGVTGADMTVPYLNAEISIANALTYEVHNAVSVDFYINDNYGGTMNLKSANTTAKTYNIDIAKDLVIPVSLQVGENGAAEATGKYVTIKMRVYFDGALQIPDSNDYYVRNETATTNNIGFSVKFSNKSAASGNTNASMYSSPQ